VPNPYPLFVFGYKIFLSFANFTILNIWSKLISFANFGSDAQAGNPTIAANGIITSASLHNVCSNSTLRTSP
jgi:hypothetical protein